MHGDDIAAGLGERRDEWIGGAIIRCTSAASWCAAIAGHDRRTDGDIGHEMAVHDVDVHPVAALYRWRRTSSPSRAKSAERIEAQLGCCWPCAISFLEEIGSTFLSP